MTKIEEMTNEAGQRTAELTAAQLKQAELTKIEKRKHNLTKSGFSEHGDDLEKFVLFA